MFGCIQKVGFMPKGQIYSFFSFEGEELFMKNKINLNPSVEVFMLDIQKQIKYTLKEMAISAHKNLNINKITINDLFE